MSLKPFVRSMYRVRQAISLLTVVAAATLTSLPAHADEDVTCTLQRSIKVKVGGSFQPLDAGAKVKVKVRKADWSTVETPVGNGVTATKVLEQQCKPLPPRPAELVADDVKPAKPVKPPKPVPPPKVVKEKPPKVVKEKIVKAPKPLEPPKTVKGKKDAPVMPVDAVEPVAVAVAVTEPAVVSVPAVVEPVVVPVVVKASGKPAPVEVVEPVSVDATRVIRVAVRSLEVGGADKRLGVLTTSGLEHEFAKRLGVSVIVLDTDPALNAEARARLAICPDDACVANIAAAVGADDVVIGTLKRGSGGHNLELRRLRALPLSPVSTYSGTAVDDEGTVRLVGAAADGLFAEHARRVDTTPGPSTELIARLTPPPVPPVATFVVAGVAVVGLGVTVAAVIVNQLAFAQGQTLAQNSSLASPASGAELATIEQSVATSFGVIVGAGIATGVVAIGAGVLAVFTDYNDLSAEPPPATPTTTSTAPLTP